MVDCRLTLVAWTTASTWCVSSLRAAASSTMCGCVCVCLTMLPWCFVAVQWQVTYQNQLGGDGSVASSIVTPLSAADAGIVYPVPTWQERTYVHRPWGESWVVWQIVCVKPLLPDLSTLYRRSLAPSTDSPGSLVIAIMTGVQILATVALSVVLFGYRNSSVIRAARHLFCQVREAVVSHAAKRACKTHSVRTNTPQQMMLLAAIITYASIFLWPYDSDTTACLAWPWFISTGVVLLLR